MVGKLWNTRCKIVPKIIYYNKKSRKIIENFIIGGIIGITYMQKANYMFV